jgi:hypothetical protein
VQAHWAAKLAQSRAGRSLCRRPPPLWLKPTEAFLPLQLRLRPPHRQQPLQYLQRRARCWQGRDRSRPATEDAPAAMSGPRLLLRNSQHQGSPEAPAMLHASCVVIVVPLSCHGEVTFVPPHGMLLHDGILPKETPR